MIVAKDTKCNESERVIHSSLNSYRQRVFICVLFRIYIIGAKPSTLAFCLSFARALALLFPFSYIIL